MLVGIGRSAAAAYAELAERMRATTCWPLGWFQMVTCEGAEPVPVPGPPPAERRLPWFSRGAVAVERTTHAGTG
jgi:hypothetical protein